MTRDHSLYLNSLFIFWCFKVIWEIYPNCFLPAFIGISLWVIFKKWINSKIWIYQDKSETSDTKLSYNIIILPFLKGMNSYLHFTTIIYTFQVLFWFFCHYFITIKSLWLFSFLQIKLCNMIPASKGHAFHVYMKIHDFGTRKTWESSHFS